MKSELEWVRSSPKARQAKNKARLERYEQMEQKPATSKRSMQMKFVFPLDHGLDQRFSLLNTFIRPLVIEF